MYIPIPNNQGAGKSFLASFLMLDMLETVTIHWFNNCFKPKCEIKEKQIHDYITSAVNEKLMWDQINVLHVHVYN